MYVVHTKMTDGGACIAGCFEYSKYSACIRAQRKHKPYKDEYQVCSLERSGSGGIKQT